MVRIVFQFRRTQVIGPRVSGGSRRREWIVRHVDAIGQDRRVEIDLAARPIPFALNPLHDERTDLDGAPSGRPGRAWVCCGIARIGYRHHHCPTLGGLGDALRDLLREMVGAELGEVLLGDRHDLRLRQERPADRVLGARTLTKMKLFRLL